jgi:hypothetical protein
LSDAEEGKLGKNVKKTLAHLQMIVDDPKRDDAIRMQASNILLPYMKPRLAAIEQTNIDPRDKLDPAELEAKLRAMYDAHPELFAFLKSERSVQVEQTEQYDAGDEVPSEAPLH